ncbi:MAG: hypothetical protein Q9168_006583 [Polycauliona sp. 1 TL-2023]
MVFDQYYDDKSHHIDDVFWDIDTGDYLARDQMTWLLKRGDEVKEGRIVETTCEQIVKVGFWDRHIEEFSSELFYNDEATPPTKLTAAVRSLCTVNFDIKSSMLWHEKSFRSPVTKEKLRRATFAMAITLGNATLGFQIAYKGYVLNRVAVDYPE